MVFLKVVSTEEIVDSLRSTDIVEKCALLIRESLLETNFDLGDKFCDANDLRQSWTNTPLPEALLRFFGVLFKFDPQSFYDTRTIKESTIVDEEEEEDDDDDNDNEEDKDVAENVQGMSDLKRRKIRVLHQIMYFNVHNDTKRTPLHILNAQSIHDKCKSK